MDFLSKNRSPENPSGKRKDKKLKKRNSSAMSLGLDETVDDSFEANTHGKKKKKSNASSDIGVMSQNSVDVFENKKHSKKKNSLSSAAPELSESFAELGGKHHEKKKKQKKKLLSVLDTELNESLEDATEGKKKKKRRSLIPDDIGFSQESLVNMADSPPKRKKKKSEGQGNLSMSETQESGLASPFKHKPDTTPKHKKKKGKVDEVTDSVKSPKEEIDKSSPLNVKKSNKKARLSLQGKESSNIEGTPKKNGYVESHEPSWSVEEELSLIDSVLGNLDPKDNAPFRRSLRKLDWKSVAIKDRTPKECNEMLDTLISKISKIKTLAMILQEAKEEVSDSSSRLKRVLSPRLRFILDYCKKHKSEEVPYNLLRLKASDAWLELSEKEKKHYELLYLKEVEKLKKTLDLPPESPKGPFELYYSSEIEKGGSKGIELKSKCRKFFSDMTIEEKSQYILESCREVSRFLSEYKSYKVSHPDFDKPMPKISGHKYYKQYFEYLGMPESINSIFGFFFYEMKRKGKLIHVEAKNKLLTANAMYRSLSDVEKTKYKEKYKKAGERYKQLYEGWKKSLNGDVAVVLETYFEKSKEQSEKFAAEHTVEVCMAKPKFNDEPEKPATTPYRLFGIKFRRQRKDKYNSAKEMEKACSSAWKSLPAESHSKYHERCLENREIYKRNLLEYVRNLGDVGKMYLGFKRKEHHQFFKEDIFEEEFPVKDYPVYVLTKREVGTLKGVVKSGALSEEGIKELKVMGIEHSKESGSESSDEDASDSDHKLENSVPKQRDLQRITAKEIISDDEDAETSDEDVSDSDHELEKSVPKLRSLQGTTAKESNSEDEDEDDNDVTQAWESLKKSHQNSDFEDDDDDDDDESEDEDDSE